MANTASLYNSYYPEMLQGQAEKAKFISNIGVLPNSNPYKMSLTDKPIYQELNKIPYEQQVEMVNKQRMLDNLRLEQNPNLGLPKTEEEKRQEYLQQIYMESFPKNAELT
jgi:hypothetical protein